MNGASPLKFKQGTNARIQNHSFYFCTFTKIDLHENQGGNCKQLASPLHR
jgi:hypothetical protein